MNTNNNDDSKSDSKSDTDETPLGISAVAVLQSLALGQRQNFRHLVFEQAL